MYVNKGLLGNQLFPDECRNNKKIIDCYVYEEKVLIENNTCQKSLSWKQRDQAFYTKLPFDN